MSLTSDWFEDAPNRKKRWDGEGLSLKEVEEALFANYSSAYPVATEMAEYIFETWTARRVAMLKKESREILFEIWDGRRSSRLSSKSAGET